MRNIFNDCFSLKEKSKIAEEGRLKKGECGKSYVLSKLRSM